MYTDTISDYLTRIRNAQRAGHKIVDMPSSRLKVDITRVLQDQGYVRRFKVVESGSQRTLKIALKYEPSSRRPAISRLVRISKPGLRKYANVKSMPRVMNGLGIAILSTPQGVMTAKQARSHNVGGEVLCYVY